MGAVFVAGAVVPNYLINTNHDRAVDDAMKAAQAIVADNSYADLNGAYEAGFDVTRTEPIFDAMWIEGRLRPFMTNLNDTLIANFKVETYDRASCVIVAVAPLQTAVESLPGDCIANATVRMGLETQMIAFR